jgi:hypothetical protein
MRLRARTIGVGAACVAILAGGAAYAAIPGGGGVISGCYSKKNGSLRVIDAEAGATCDNGSVTLTWNQQGPAGPQGIAGPQGAAGLLRSLRASPFSMPPASRTPGSSR